MSAAVESAAEGTAKLSHALGGERQTHHRRGNEQTNAAVHSGVGVEDELSDQDDDGRCQSHAQGTVSPQGPGAERERAHGDGGIIVAGPDGRIGWAYNTPRMARALARGSLPKAFAAV